MFAMTPMPSTPGKMDARKELRLHRADEARIRAAAAATGLQEADFIRQAALLRAQEVEQRLSSRSCRSRPSRRSRPPWRGRARQRPVWPAPRRRREACSRMPADPPADQPSFAIARFDKARHDRSAFSCGVAPINNFLKSSLSDQVKAGMTVT